MIPDDFKIYNYNYNQTDIYAIDATTRSIKRITDMPNSNEMFPVVSEDDKEILFVSDLNGVNNVYKKRIVFNSSDENISDITQIKAKPVTNSQSGLYHLTLSKDGKKLAFNSLYDRSFSIFLLNNPFELEQDVDAIPLTKFRQGLFNLTSPTLTELVKNEKLKEDVTDSTFVNESPFFTGNIIDEDNKDSVKTDYGNFIFGKNDNDTTSTIDSVNVAFNPTDNLDSNGNYKVNKYKITFGPDLILC